MRSAIMAGMSGYIRIDPALWREIQRAYEHGEGDMPALSQHFGVAADTIRKRCQRHEWRAPDAPAEQSAPVRLTEGAAPAAASLREAVFALREALRFARARGGAAEIATLAPRLADAARKLATLEAQQTAAAPPGREYSDEEKEALRQTFITEVARLVTMRMQNLIDQAFTGADHERLHAELAARQNEIVRLCGGKP